MNLPDWIAVVPRPFPSSTMVVIYGPQPIVIDPGAASDADLLPKLLGGTGVAMDQVSTVVCSHYHSDHVGAVAALQKSGAEVASHEIDAVLVNSRDSQACAARWLDQPVLPYRVDRSLAEGDVVSSGEIELQVIHTPGHTRGGISLWEPNSGILICGDALQADDTPWIGAPREDADSLGRIEQTLDLIQSLAPSLVISGHGPVIEDVDSAIRRTRDRLASWSADPAACAMHAAKRIFTYRLMFEPIPNDEVRDYLHAIPWLGDLASSIDLDDSALIDALLDALKPSLKTEGKLLRTTAPHRQSPISVPWQFTHPDRWPLTQVSQAK